MLKSKYKVIIIGAGPAGLAAALKLKKLGISDILVVERFTFPRYKCCAGYVTAKTGDEYKKLGLDIEECNYSLIKDFNIFYKNKNRLNIVNKFLYTNRTIDRVELDNAFFGLAKSNGIEVAEGVKITAHSPENNAVKLSDGTTAEYENLIFADGTNGFGSRYQKSKRKNIAMQLTFESDISESIQIHFGVTKRGYGWVSSYNGVANVGLTDVYNSKINYRNVFENFLKQLDICADISGLKAAFTPMCVGKPIVFGNVFFVGDAVGACDPMTLSGLRYGLKSGEKCAEAIAVGKIKIYKKYVKTLKTRFAFMRAVQRVFYFAPVLCFGFGVFCRFFGKTVSRVFNNFFVNKK